MPDPVNSFHIDTSGIRLPARVIAPVDVYFDRQHVWSFAADELPVRDEIRHTAWPRAMSNWLDGPSRISLRINDQEIHAQEVRFSDRVERVAFVDENEIPVMIDKWGLIQRPFSGRDPAVVTQMLDVTEQIIAILKEECDVDCWLAFGSLLGAAREGGVIAFDSDVDLAYLSNKRSPAEMNVEMFEMTRVLRRHGLRVLNKTGAFITVIFDAPDGAEGSVDVYTCFHFDGLLYETATVRTPVPVSDILPLRTLPFEGRELPVPASYDALLCASYGPSWRVPDPSFRHLPGPEITNRFDDWFGSLMKNRRDWERFIRRTPDDLVEVPTDFYHWVGPRLDPDAAVFDVGTGLGRNAVAFARAGRMVIAADYARHIYHRAEKVLEDEGLGAHFVRMNFLELRDVLTATARVTHLATGPRALFAAGIIEALEEEGRRNFRQMLSVFGREGDQIFLEFAPGDPGPHDPNKGGRRTRIETDEVVEWLDDVGAVVEYREPGGSSIDGRDCVRIQARYGPRHLGVTRTEARSQARKVRR